MGDFWEVIKCSGGGEEAAFFFVRGGAVEEVLDGGEVFHGAGF